MQLTRPTLATQQALNEHLAEWSVEIDQFRENLRTYGNAKADLEYSRAQARAHARHDDPKVTGTKLDDLVESRQDVHELHAAFRLVEADVEAGRARLRWFQAMADALRSQIATERGERALYADHGGHP